MRSAIRGLLLALAVLTGVAPADARPWVEQQLIVPGVPSAGGFNQSTGGTTGGSSLLPGDSVGAFFGDSQAAQNNFASATGGSEELSVLGRGMMAWQRITDPRGRWDNWYDPTVTGRLWTGQNQGFSGDQTSDAIARLPTLLAITNLKWVAVDLATNDLNAGTALATIENNLKTIYKAIIDAGAKVIIVTPTPRPTSGTNSWAIGSGARNNWLQLCTDLQDWATNGVTISGTPYAASNFIIVRGDLLLSNLDADRTPITSPQPVLQTDNVHRTPYGGWLLATSPGGLNAALASIMQPFTGYVTHPVAGDIFPNPTLTGTTGTCSGSCSGQAATGMTVSATGTGVTVVASKEADGSQTLVISTAGTGSTSDLVRFGITSATIAPPADGTWMRGQAQLSVSSNTILMGVNKLSRGQPSGANIYAYAMKQDTPNRWPLSTAIPLHYQQTPPFVTRTGTTGMIDQIFISVDGTQTGSATVNIKRMHLYPITDPRPSLGF